MKRISITLLFLQLILFTFSPIPAEASVFCSINASSGPDGTRELIVDDWSVQLDSTGHYEDIFLNYNDGGGNILVGKLDGTLTQVVGYGYSHVYSSFGEKKVTLTVGLDACVSESSAVLNDIQSDLGTICVASNIPTSWLLTGPSGSYSYTFPAGNFSCRDDVVGDWTISSVPAISGYDGPYFSPASLTQTLVDEGFIGWDITYTPSNIDTDGSCGTAAINYTPNQTNFSGSFCASGVASPSSPGFPDPGFTTTWQCLGSGNGIDATCSATRDPLAPIYGSCGTANRTYLWAESSYGTDTFCSSGNLSPGTPSFPNPGFSSLWQCLGSNGGGDAFCQATRGDETETLDVSVSNISGGKVTSSPGGIDCGVTCSANYNKNANVVLTASTNSSYWKFAGWGGSCSTFGISKTCNLSMDSSKYVTAKFVARIFEYLEF
ncbi:MAG: hypothetical protein WAW92_00540 [Minisyncoccia bacterium]